MDRYNRRKVYLHREEAAGPGTGFTKAEEQEEWSDELKQRRGEETKGCRDRDRDRDRPPVGIGGRRREEEKWRTFVRRRRSFVSSLLWKSFQDGVHLLRNGSQRKLKLILEPDKDRRDKRREEERE